MRRARTALAAFVVGGGLAATTVTSRGAFVMAFFVVFWGSIAAFLALIASRRHGGAELPSTHDRVTYDTDHRSPGDVSDLEELDDFPTPGPFIDKRGVNRFPGDVFDLENFPTPGAHGDIGKH